MTSRRITCGRSEEALALVERAIDGGYCAYPIIDGEPLLASARSLPRFAEIRAKGQNCQARFVAEAGIGKSPP